jgi:hypothetical protein
VSRAAKKTSAQDLDGTCSRSDLVLSHLLWFPFAIRGTVVRQVLKALTYADCEGKLGKETKQEKKRSHGAERIASVTRPTVHPFCCAFCLFLFLGNTQ